MAEKVEKLLEAISELSVMELSELVKGVEEKFGVSAMPVMAAGAPAAGGAAPAEAAEEKSEYNVVLTASGEQKIAVIKKADAEEAKKKLEEAGATVELK